MYTNTDDNGIATAMTIAAIAQLGEQVAGSNPVGDTHCVLADLLGSRCKRECEVPYGSMDLRIRYDIVSNRSRVSC